MKKVTLIVAIAIGTIFTSCEKEENKLGTELKNNSMLYKLDNIPFSNNLNPESFDLINLMSNPEDADDEKINNYLYKISLATRDLIKKPNFNQLIITMAQGSETQSANLLDLETTRIEYFNSINNNLATDGLTLQLIANDLTHAPIAPNPAYPRTAIIEKYIPAICIPNLINLDPGLQPIISPNIEVDSRFDETIEDNVISWYWLTEEASTVEVILLSEDVSLSTTNPLFFLDNAVTTLTTEIDTSFTPYNTDRMSAGSGSSDPTGSVLSFSSYEHSIESNSYRYEPWTSGKSEFAINEYRITPSGSIIKRDLMINKIKKNEIGTIRYKWDAHAGDWKPWANPWTPNVIQTGVEIVF